MIIVYTVFCIIPVWYDNRAVTVIEAKMMNDNNIITIGYRVWLSPITTNTVIS